ncbi:MULTISPECIES: anion permease [unclassified Brachybacterium]|uniref:inorganic phosphate transporter n=1 Tax=unclassified Brachybacterium TaxID=2623841 RepID=UPI003F9C25E3
MTTLMLVLVVVLALAMAYMNGFHDASNAVTTTITTRTLRESTALALAAILNVLGALLGMMLIVASAPWALRLLGMTPLTQETAGQPDVLGLVLIAIMLATIGWDLLTWWLGMPSSTWHAFFGSTVGVSLAIGAPAAWERLGLLLVVSLVGPVLSAVIAYLLMQLVLVLGRHERLLRGHLRFAQTVSAGAVATGHGLNDSRLPLAVIVIAFAATGGPPSFAVTLMVAVALAIGLGTLVGGHRIIRVLGRHLTDLNVAQGLAAETSAAVTMSLGLFGVGSPVSTSHALASSVVGAGVAQGLRNVRWQVAGKILLIWLATPLACAVVGAALVGTMLAMSSR